MGRKFDDETIAKYNQVLNVLETARVACEAMLDWAAGLTDDEAFDYDELDESGWPVSPARDHVCNLSSELNRLFNVAWEAVKDDLDAPNRLAVPTGPGEAPTP